MRIIILVLPFYIASFLVVAQRTSYICPPCGCASDGKKFESAGSCPSCSMTLLNESNKSEGLRYQNLEPDEVCELQSENPEVLFLDVRTKREFDRSPLGRIKDAKHIHIDELASRVGELEAYKDREIIVYCLIGIRSARASEYLSENGFTEVKNMLGGMELWNELRDDSFSCKKKLLERN